MVGPQKDTFPFDLYGVQGGLSYRAEDEHVTELHDVQRRYRSYIRRVAAGQDVGTADVGTPDVGTADTGHAGARTDAPGSVDTGRSNA